MTAAAHNQVPDFASGWGFFLDVDGTLLDIAQRPEDAQVSARVDEVLRTLVAAVDGAVALVSGRALADLDRLFAPLRLPLAALHGVERRTADDDVYTHHDPAAGPRFRECCVLLAAWAEARPGVQFEDKGEAASVHFRRAPERGAEVEARVRDAVSTLGDDYHLHAGKMVWEVRPSGRDKGTAIAEFMREPPFAGCTPVFIGDDLTDEDGFRVVNDLGGHAVKVGAGASAAPWRLPDAAAVLRWLADYARFARAPAGNGA